MVDKKKLIFITDCFPFDIYEPFIANEFRYIESSFEKIFIFSTSEKKITKYELSNNVEVYNLFISLNLFSKIKAILLFKLKIFRVEKKFVNAILKSVFSFSIIKIFFIENLKARMFRNYIKKTLYREFKKPESLVVYAYWSDNKAITAALLKKEFPMLKAISRAHRWDVYFEENTSGYLPFRKFIFDTLDNIFFVSDNGKEYTIKKYRNQPNFRVSYLGTHKPAEPKFSKKKNPFHIVSCSACVLVKRIDLLVNAIALLSDVSEIQWTHFGTGALFHEILKFSKEKLTGKPNINFNFEGQIDNEDVLKFYSSNNINIFINTASSEGLPMSMMEAMSCGIPVMGTNVGGVSEIVTNDFNGCLLSPNPTPAEISDKIQMFIDMDKERYAQFSMNAYETWNTKFNAAINFPAFLKEVL
jgi:colanic acid/amylovoran biosynthesis glycosyltransferase